LEILRQCEQDSCGPGKCPRAVRTSAENGLGNKATQPISIARLLTDSLSSAVINMVGMVKPPFASVLCKFNTATLAKLNIDNETDRYSRHRSIKELLSRSIEFCRLEVPSRAKVSGGRLYTC
jgi:hypothetical protein